MAVAGVKADLCLNCPALGTVREGWAAHASQLSVSGFSLVLVGHLEGKAQRRERQGLPSMSALLPQQTHTRTCVGLAQEQGGGRALDLGLGRSITY